MAHHTASLLLLLRNISCLPCDLLQVATQRRIDREAGALLTHQLAISRASAILHHWRTSTTAVRHRRRLVLQALLGHWRGWVARHTAASARVRRARDRIDARKRERLFYSWRWYTQVGRCAARATMNTPGPCDQQPCL